MAEPWGNSGLGLDPSTFYHNTQHFPAPHPYLSKHPTVLFSLKCWSPGCSRSCCFCLSSTTFCLRKQTFGYFYRTSPLPTACHSRWSLLWPRGGHVTQAVLRNCWVLSEVEMAAMNYASSSIWKAVLWWDCPYSMSATYCFGDKLFHCLWDLLLIPPLHSF
jgi:hypothetical protein